MLQENNSQEFLRQTSPPEPAGWSLGPKGLQSMQGLTRGYFLAQLPQTNGKGCEGGVCSRMLDLKYHSQQHSQGLKGRAKKSPVVPSERQGEDSDKPWPPFANSPAERVGTRLRLCSTWEPHFHSVPQFPCRQSRDKTTHTPRPLGRRRLSNCEAAGEYFLNKAAEFLPRAQMLW